MQTNVVPCISMNPWEISDVIRKQPQNINLTGYRLKQFFLKLVHSIFALVKVDGSSTTSLICELMPSQCPFKREIYFQNHKLFQIFSLGPFNPVYEKVIVFRFREFSYLADQCSKDINRYIH